MHKLYTTLVFVFFISTAFTQNFVTTWKTDNPGLTEENQILISTYSSETYNYIVNWGDGSSDAGVTGNIIHTYAQPGTYQVSISGDFPGILFGSSEEVDNEKLLEINQWGNIQWKTFQSAFNSCVNMEIKAEDVPDLSQVTNFRAAFFACSSLQGNDSMNLWDMTNVINLNSMFYRATSFNANISNWNLSNVEEMNDMFRDAVSFNQDIGNWRFPKVNNISFMFDGATNFNGDISDWEVGHIEGMAYLFQYAESFNQDISNWDMSSVISTGYMFNNAKAFNQDISGWNVGNVRSMAGMFTNARSFNQDLGSWNVQSVITMSNMFKEVKLSTENYDAILNGWAALSNLQRDIVLDAGFSQYCNGESSKEDLINNFGWQISDDGQSCPEPLSIQEIFLVDAVQDEILYTLRENAHINRQSLLNQLVNFEVLATNDVGSVEIELSDTQDFSSVSNNVPFTLFGTNGADYLGNTMPSGTYTLVATPYSGDDLTGIAGAPYILNFKILDGASKAFITTWQINEPTYVRIQTLPGEHYYYDIDWDDGTSFLGNSGTVVYNYTSPGTYTIRIQGDFPGIVFEGNNSAQRLISVDQWGDMDWESMEGAFSGCTNFDILATDVPDLSNVESMARTFQNCSSLSGTAQMSTWDLSNVKDMSEMFSGAEIFNQNITGWVVSSVTEMSGLFEGATSFNQNLNSWDISQVANMENMFTFSGLSNTNYETMLTSWGQLPSLQNGVRLGAQQNNYCDAAEARQDLISNKGWIIHDGGLSVNCAIDGKMPFLTTWKTDNYGSSNSNQITIYTDTRFDGFNYTVDWGDGSIDANVQGDIVHTYPDPGIYRVAIYGDFLGMYINNGGNARLRDDDKLLSVDQWGDIQWELLHLAFAGCDNLDVKANDTPDFSNGPNLFGMFVDCKRLVGNESINTWDLTTVDNIAYMFNGATVFNQPLNKWDTSNVTYMYNVFQEASSFDQNIDTWDVSSVINMTNMFDDSGFSDENYNSALISWEKIPSLQNNVQLGAPQNMYCEAAIARYELIKKYNWEINDQGRSFGCTIYHPEEAFVTIWKTDNEGVSGDSQITLPLLGGPYGVDWGDGTIETDLIGNTTHTYANPGIYTISVFGTPNSTWMTGSNSGTLADDAPKLLEIKQWGAIKWLSMSSAFGGCVNMDVTATDTPDLSNVNSLYSMFNGCTSLIGNDSINTWDVSTVQNLSQTFRQCEQFNVNISGWNTENVISMANLFEECRLFNQDISGWNVSKVQDTSGMFHLAIGFNQDIGTWDVSNVINMNSMFQSSNFNADISNWNVSRVRGMEYMFSGSEMFNQDISNWDVFNVQSMRGMFSGAHSFDQELGKWNIYQVVDLTEMFSEAGISINNYDETLIGWSNLPFLRLNIVFDAGRSQYCESAAARQFIIDTFGWAISDGGETPLCSQDIDNDGVFDYGDSCLDTQPGVDVNEDGCDFVPLDAIQVYTLTPSCPNSYDGSIEISMEPTGYLLDIVIEGDGYFNQVNDVSSGNGFSVNDLPTGTYSVTISIPEIHFDQSYGVTINELNSINGKRASFQPELGTVSYSVSGSKSYEVSINGERSSFVFDTPEEQNITLTNLNGQIDVAITGESECQGKILDGFFITDTFQVFPTITSEEVNFVTRNDSLKVLVFGIDGRLIKVQEYNGEEKRLDVSTMETGMYILQLNMDEEERTIKIIKR